MTAGRGFLVIAGSKAWFMLTSAVLALGLPRFFGDAARFGEFKVVYSLISVLNMVLIIGTIQTVSKLVSEEPTMARGIRRTALRLQLTVGVVVAGTLVLFAEPITARAFRDTSLAPYLRVGAGVTLIYALYGVFVGIMNGLERFTVQAKVDILFSTLKVALIAGLVLTGLGVLGAFSGFVGAAFCVLIVGGIVVQKIAPPDDGRRLAVRRFVRLLAPLLGTTLMLNLMLQLDVMAIKGLVATTSTEETSRLAGLFGGAKNVALLPYQATFALTLVVFPMLSRATFEDDTRRAATYVRQAMRFTLIVAVLACVPLVAVARPLLEIVMGAKYGASTGALVTLLPTTVLISALVLCVTLLNAAGRERTALVITTLTVAVNMGLLWLLLHDITDDQALDRAAWATCGSVLVGFLGGAVAVWRRFGAFAPFGTVFRLIGLSGAILVADAWLVSAASLLGVVAEAVIIGLLLIAGLVLTGELADSDRAALKRILGRAP